MNLNKYENENKISEKHIFSFLVVLQSLVFLVWLILGINPALMVVFASASLGSTISVYTIYNKKKSKEDHFIELSQEQNLSKLKTEKYCTNCGMQIELEDKYCDLCGFQSI